MSLGYRGFADDDLQPFNAFLAGFSATVGQFVLTGRFSRPDWNVREEEY